MIREAGLRDWPEVSAKVFAFNDAYFHIPVNEDKLYGWFEQHVSTGVILLSAAGLIAGLRIVDPVRDWTVLAETAWYDTGRDGVRLLRDFIQVGRARHVDEVRMTTLNTTPPGVTKLLSKHGFEEIERSHRLIL
jgi:hypothetical protein